MFTICVGNDDIAALKLCCELFKLITIKANLLQKRQKTEIYLATICPRNAIRVYLFY